MNPLGKDFFYPHSRDTLYYKYGKPLFLLKVALTRKLYPQEAEEYDTTHQQMQEAIKNFPQMKRYGYKKLVQALEDNLMDMDRYGFDFYFRCDPSLFKYFKKKRRIYRPHQHMQMTCMQCKSRFAKNKSGKQKSRWTTSKGTMCITYVVVKIDQFNKRVPESCRTAIPKKKKLKTPYMVVFHPKIYSMLCKFNCESWAFVLLYEPWVQYFCEKLCLEVWEAIGNIRHYRPHRQDLPQDKLKKHEQQLCEACKKGVCGGFNRST